jgi:putative nucleotidyltransferase with HDIG domain
MTTTAHILASRCASIGLPSWYVEPHGTITAAPWPGSNTVRAWIGSHRVRETIRKALGESPTSVILEPAPGFRLIPLRFRRGEWGLVAFAPGPHLSSTDLFGSVCNDAALSQAWARGEFDAMPSLDSASVTALAQALGLWAEDLADVREKQSTIDGFSGQLSESFDAIEFLYGLGRAMRDPARPEEFVNFMCERLKQTMDFGWIGAGFHDVPHAPKLTDHFVFNGTVDDRIKDRTKRLLSSPHPDNQTSILVDDPGRAGGGPQIILQPIVRDNTEIGAIFAGAKTSADVMVSSYDTQLVEAAAGFAGAFLETVSLHREQQALFVGTVHAITAAIDAKDRYTRGHSERVAMLASRLAERVGEPPAECERVRLAGLLHDVGKIGVPETVLTKTTKLTDVEFELIKQHPTIGYHILKDIPQLKDVLPGVLHHHERWDGRGYPHKLAGDSIPRIARFLGLADTFDAMSSTRAYRAAMPRDKVMTEILRCAGTQFDPNLVPVFLGLDFAEYDDLVARHSALERAA